MSSALLRSEQSDQIGEVCLVQRKAKVAQFRRLARVERGNDGVEELRDRPSSRSSTRPLTCMACPFRRVSTSTGTPRAPRSGSRARRDEFPLPGLRSQRGLGATRPCWAEFPAKKGSPHISRDFSKSGGTSALVLLEDRFGWVATFRGVIGQRSSSYLSDKHRSNVMKRSFPYSRWPWHLPLLHRLSRSATTAKTQADCEKAGGVGRCN
jgi:hypothetical protein